MKLLNILLASALLSAVSISDALADRWHRGPRVGIGVVIGPYWGPFYSAYGPYMPYPAPVHYPPVVVERTPPPVYIEQSFAEPASGYWYYCQASRAYYPYVKTCRRGWIPVAPQPDNRP